MHYMPDLVYTEETVKQFLQENQGDQARNYAVVLPNEQHVIGHIKEFHRFESLTWSLSSHSKTEFRRKKQTSFIIGIRQHAHRMLDSIQVR